VHVDLIGPWNINTSNNDAPVTLLALIIIDPATSWFVITPPLEKEMKPLRLHLINNGFANTLDYDNGTEFVGMEFQEMLASYRIQAVKTTVTNPQANAIISHMLHTSNSLKDSAATKIHIEQQLCNTNGNQYNLSYNS